MPIGSWKFTLTHTYLSFEDANPIDGIEAAVVALQTFVEQTCADQL